MTAVLLSLIGPLCSLTLLFAGLAIASLVWLLRRSAARNRTLNEQLGYGRDEHNKIVRALREGATR